MEYLFMVKYGTFCECQYSQDIMKVHLKNLCSRRTFLAEGVYMSGEESQWLWCNWKAFILISVDYVIAETRTFKHLGLHSERRSTSYSPRLYVHTAWHWIGHQQTDGWSLQVTMISVVLASFVYNKWQGHYWLN